MKKLLVKTFSIALLFSSAATFIHAEQCLAAPEGSLKEVAHLHLASLPTPLVKEKKEKPEEEKTALEKLGFEEPIFTVIPTSYYEQINLGYSLLAGNLNDTFTTRLHSTTFKDLELFCGTSSKEINLLQLINRTHIAEGEIALATLLANPITDIQELTKRQTIIKALAGSIDQENSESLDLLFSELQKYHAAFTSFWGAEHATTQLFMDAQYFKLAGLKSLNTNVAYQHFATTYAAVAPFLATGIYLAATGYYWTHREKISNFWLGILSGWTALNVRFLPDSIKTYHKIITYMHERTLGIGALVNIIEATHRYIKNNPELKHLSTFEKLENFVANKNFLSGKLVKLLDLTKTDTFKGEPRVLALHGRTKAAFALMMEVRNELLPALSAIAEIDAYLSCAKLYKEFESKENSFAFATYIENAEKPHALLYNMWNPFVGSEKSVVNSVELGGNMPANMILTGPNAGGKSTFSKGVALSLVLGQTIGLVPAKAAAFTPFAKINTYMNIADDTAGGNSLFKSEVMRAQQLLDTINTLDKNQFSFSVMDEVFSGTSPKEGEAASCAVAKNLATKTNSIAIIATHFQKMKELEDTHKAFKNYQVRVVRHTDGSFSYPFKLQFGAADQNVAIEMLKNEGFETSIVQDALGILNDTVKVSAAA